jgi:hypothetical protein
MTVTEAAECIAAEIEVLTDHEANLLRDLGRTRANRENLLRSIDCVLATLPPEGRRALQLRLNRAAVALAGELRDGVNVTDKVEALHEYLARADGPVTVKGVQAHLRRHGLAPYDDAAALLLARKCKQGMVKRIGRGRYSVNPHHPAVASRRLDP